MRKKNNCDKRDIKAIHLFVRSGQLNNRKTHYKIYTQIPKPMKKIILAVISIYLLSCTSDNEKLITQAINNLNTEDVISYKTSILNTQGNPNTNDTTKSSSESYSIFKKSTSDTIIGYEFAISTSLIHPIIKIPGEYGYYYDGKQLINYVDWALETKKTTTCLNEINTDELKAKFVGKTPQLLDILKLRNYNLINSVDTVINNTRCLQINVLSLDSIRHELFITKESKLPYLLRIIEDPKQPSIDEYFYSNFKKQNIFDIPDFASNEKETRKRHEFVFGSKFPIIDLDILHGGKISTDKFEGSTTLIVMSAIYCGYCQKIVPHINNIYSKYKESKNIKLYSLYPMDEKDKLIKYVSIKNIQYPILYKDCKTQDERGEILGKLYNSYPTTIILNQEGKIIFLKSGSDFENGIDWESQIESEFKKAHNRL